MTKFVMRSGPPSPAGPGLIPGVKSITLTLSAGAGSVPLRVDATRVGIYPAASAAGRIGLGAAPVAIGTKTGNAVETDLTLGMPLVDSVWQWFDLSLTETTTLYFIGAAAGVFTVVVV